MIVYRLPAPPSVNNLFRNVPGKGRVRSSEYVAWCEAAGWSLRAQGARSQTATVKLPDLGVTKTQSSRWQKLASVPDEQFEAVVDRAVLRMAAMPKCSPQRRPGPRNRLKFFC